MVGDHPDGGWQRLDDLAKNEFENTKFFLENNEESARANFILFASLDKPTSKG